ncbi:MAG: cation-transporting P-type ATPase [Planctomycetales bacterium]|nr:cation-transporting P-type ATPase [Planctomycetales bacterium]
MTRQIHEIAASAVYGALGSRPSGLTAAEVRQRQLDVGLNRLASAPRWRWLQRLAGHFVNFFSILLDVAAAGCFVAHAMEPSQGMGLLGWTLLGVSMLNALFSFAQEMRAERAMDELRKFLPTRVQVIREGQQLQTVAEDLVPGDLLCIAEGDRVAADARVVDSLELLVNNAPLTGESRSIPIQSRPARGRLVDGNNVVFAGCTVLRGKAKAIVFATGQHTEFGKIAELSRDVVRRPAPLQRNLKRMVRQLTAIALVMGTIFFFIGMAIGRPLWINVVFMLGIIVANVPEGLLPTFTLALSMAGLRMARKQVLVKNLEAVESLGAVHVVCTDKTGTLTLNQLAVDSLVDAITGHEIECRTSRDSLLKAALIASDVQRATDTNGQLDRVVYRGDPMDVAIATEFVQGGGAAEAMLARTRRHFPFDLARRREAGLLVAEGEVLFAVKGAWESLRPLIGAIASDGRSHAADEPRLARCDATVRQRAGQGQRVIAVATRWMAELPSPTAAPETIERGLELQGFVTLNDPIREEVPAAVERCHAAGVRVLMITGDHPDTALAVAQTCGILPADDESGGRVLSGAELDTLTHESLTQALQAGATVFARSTPEHKLKIINALRELGENVAMTGDGVNDAPALRAADVGVAMGVSGTDVAREAADVVLLDDNFASITAGIEEGRAVYDNMKKFTTYVLTSNVPEIVPFLLYVVFPVPLALTVLQILCIDLGTDLLPAIGLGQEPPEPTTMRRPPRRSDEGLLTWRLMATSYLFLGIIETTWSLALFFLVLHQSGWHWGSPLSEDDPIYQAATGTTLAAIILMQVGNVVGRRSLRRSGLDSGLLKNPLILMGIAVELTIAVAIVYCPPVNRLLQTAPVDRHVFLLAFLGIPLLFGLDCLRKVTGLRRDETWSTDNEL